MPNTKRISKLFVILMIALLPGALLAGCRGNLGWDRMEGPVGRQGPSSLHHAQAR